MPKLASRDPRTLIFLGAGFSKSAGVPLASELFREEPAVDRVTRQRLVRTVRGRWLDWQETHNGTPEEYLAELETEGGKHWSEAVWYVSLVIALRMGELRSIGFQQQLTLTKQNVDRRSSPLLEDFWTAVFSKIVPGAVLTTNYDILAERGMRHKERPRAARPGFNYGNGQVDLAGGGYPSYAHIQKITASGTVPLFKLHGSVSWTGDKGQPTEFHDCRPAIRGDALIVAPVRGKRPPASLDQVWKGSRNAIRQAKRIVVVGYSLPEYDDQVIELLRASPDLCHFHVLDPNPEIAQKFEDVLGRPAIQHAGLPEGIDELGFLCDP